MTLRQFFGIVELRTKIVSVSTYTIGLLYSLCSTGSVSPLLAALVFVSALAVDMGTTGFNSYFDWYRNVDDPRFNREDAKVLVHEGVSPGAALLVSILCYLFAMAVGIVIVAFAGPLVLLLGIISLAVGFFYSGGSRPISSTPWGELFAGGFLGFVFFITTVYILTGHLSWQAVLAALPQSLAIAAILSVNNACDMQGDAAAGRRTLAILLGPVGAELLVYAEGLAGLLGFGLLAWWKLLPSLTGWFAALAAIFVIREYIKMHRRGYAHDTKGPNMQSISTIFMVQSGVTVLGLLGRVLHLW